jgi:TP901 family phage tail tape measure protein
MAIIVPIVSAWNPAGLNKALADIRKAEGSLNKFAAGTQSIGKQMQSVGMSLSTKVTLPLALMGAASLRTAADFEVAMAQVGVATDTPVAGLENLSSLAKQLGADTIFSANEAAQAMLELAKAGISPAQIEAGALSNTLNLAAASGMGLAESAVIMSAGMNTFNLSAKDSTSIVDALAGAANASAADVADIAMALQQTGQQAVASGLTIQETTAALAAFADAGVRGSDAGTSFKTFLQRLNPVSKEAAKTMKQLGIEFFDTEGNMKDLTQIAGEVQKGFKGLTQEQRLAAMQTIFGSDALRAANILYEEGSDGITKYIDASTKSGSAAEMADARMSGLAGALEAMKGSIETAALAIGESLSPTIKDVAKRIQDFANAFSNLSPQMQNAIIKFALIAAVVGPAILLAGALITALGNIAVAVGVVGTVVGFLRAQWIGVGTAATGAATASVIATTIIKRALITTGVGALIIGLGFVASKFYDAAKAADDFGAAKERAIKGGESRDAARSAGRNINPNETKDLSDQFKDLNLEMANVSPSSSKAASGLKGLSAAGKAAQESMTRLGKELQMANDFLKSAQDKYEAFRTSVTNSIKNVIDFGAAMSRSRDTQNNAVEATKALAEAQNDYNESLKTGNIKEQEDALKKLNEAQSTATKSVTEKKSFLQVLQEQADQASTFSSKVQTLISMGLSEGAIGQVLAAGADAGTAIADEIIAGGSTVVAKVDQLVAATALAAEQLAAAGKVQFYDAGLAQGQALVDGVKAAIAAAGFVVNIEGGLVNQGAINAVNAAIEKARSGKGKKKKITKSERQSIMDLAASLGVEVPAFAKGGIVTGPTLALIGEAGPEAVVPLSGPNSPMGATYNISINAGMGADGAVIGREIVDAIKRYERASGPVFASA